MPARTGKIIQFDWSTLSQYDDSETFSVCLTQRQAMILKSALIPAYWSRRWLGFPGGTYAIDNLDAMISLIDNQLDGNECETEIMEYRDNPLDPCEVQYSRDQGVTWSTMFRKDNCFAPATADDITNIYTDIDNVETNYTTYAGDITNNAPKWGWVDSDSDKALCWAIDFYVDWVCDLNIGQIESHNAVIREGNDFVDEAAEMLGAAVVGAITFFAGTPITMPAVAMGAIAYASLEIAENVWDYIIGLIWDDDPAPFQDEDAKDAVKCLMYQAMEGETPDFAKWRDSLEDHAQMGGYFEAVAGAVHVTNQSVNIFINYMILMEELNDIRAILPGCDCDERWEHTWNFTTHGFDTWTLAGYGHGTLVPDFGADAECIDTGTYNTKEVHILTFAEGSPRCDTWSFFYIGVKGTFDANVTAFEWYNPPQAMQDQSQAYFFTGNHEMEHAFTLDHITSFQAYIACCSTEDPCDGTAYIYKITLGGVGVDPFIGRVTS